MVQEAGLVTELMNIRYELKELNRILREIASKMN